MRNLFNVLIVMCAISLLGCNAKSDVTEIKVEVIKKVFPESLVNLTSPDNAIKTYWKMLIWNDTLPNKDTSFLFLYTAEAKIKLKQSAIKSMNEHKIDNFRTGKKIDKVEIETDSRAVVWVSEFLYQGDKDPDKSKYTLSKANNKWLIEGIEETCSYCNGTGIWLREKCSICEGLGYSVRL